MGSGAMIYTPRFINTGSKLVGGDSGTHRNRYTDSIAIA
jgi:hypothetical protein